MPTLLLSFKRNSDSSILIHGTLTPNEKQSQKEMEQHAGVCPKFGPAYRDDETIQHAIDVDAIPEFDEDAIGEWLDELLGLEDEEDDEEITGETEEDD